MRRLLASVFALWLGSCSSDTLPVPDDSVPDVAVPEGPELPVDVCSAQLPTLSSARLTTDGPRLRDALGREVLLRGVNAGGQSKLPPFVPFTVPFTGDFDAAVGPYADRVVAWGHNVVRLPVTWDAIEPQRDQFDADFMAQYNAMIQAFGDRGIRVIVDFHQDVYARPFCGDGFPIWTVIEPIDETAERDCHQWFQGYLTDDEVKTAYDHFWADTDGLQGEFEAFWRHLAGETKHHDAVIGFEIINEPGWGSASPETWAKEVLTPFYTRMISVVREVSPDTLIFFDSTGTDAVAAATALERPVGDNLVFAPHFYDPLAILQGIWTGYLESLDEPIGAWRIQGDAWDVPVLLGEFGIKANADNGSAYVRLNWEALDAHLMHGTQWEYSASEVDWNSEGMSLTNASGVEQPTAAEAMRAYPSAVAGTIESFVFDRDALTGTLVFAALAGGVTEIVVPTRLYPDGVAATLTGVEGCTTLHSEAQRLGVKTSAAGTATVTFAPASSGN
jgi:endoglycosylceramidase